MTIQIYEKLPEEAIVIRTKVFMEEQGFKDEFDEIDSYATHVVLSENAQPVATCRFFYSKTKDCFVIGRIAVAKEFRGRNYGAEILKAAEQKILKKGGHKIGLFAQSRVSEFYAKQGYNAQGEVYLDEGCPHIWMHKKVEKS